MKVSVRLKNELEYRGRMNNVDSYMNLILLDAEEFNGANPVANYALHLHPVLIIIDNFSYLFLNEKKKSLSIQFRLRKHLHDLAIYALENDIAVVITNSISSKRENKRSEDIFEKRILSFNELLNNIISNLTHVSLELKAVKTDEPRYSAGLLKPATSTKSYFMVRPDGLHDC
jgi:small nuclear ribonucleoprotein (snRNP)-like protein